ncbi:hypothetical protein VNI00_013567 [Paramarasmius palmivorus]|uniref:Brain protein I3 n=1 Tax=Paramarasmius palmivorus TaxID=297713 RepID=A0AAW0BXT4_9AGAR
MAEANSPPPPMENKEQSQQAPVTMQAPPPPDPAVAGEEYRATLFAQCAQGIHQPTTKYGMCGIITAIMCFPCGLICLFSDTEQKCDRCGVILEK